MIFAFAAGVAFGGLFVYFAMTCGRIGNEDRDNNEPPTIDPTNF